MNRKFNRSLSQAIATVPVRTWGVCAKQDWSNTARNYPLCVQALLALAAGFGHAMAHGLVFSLAWLPLASGQGVLYIKSCSTMSWAPAAAFTVLGFFGLHTGSMVVAFDALSRQKLHRAWAVGVVHLAAALLTLTNRAADACSLVATVELVLGTCMMAAAAFVFRTEMVAPVTYAPIAADDDGQ